MREQIAQHTIPRRASYTTTQRQVQRSDDIEEDDSYYPQRMPSSSRRYYDTRGNQVIQQGNRRIVVHNEPPSGKRSVLLPLGVGMLIMVLVFFGATQLSSWWANHQLDAQYGMPRTWQTDQVVGHSDSTDHPTHFIFLNLNGQVQIIELPGGDSAHAKIYNGGRIFADNAASVSVTGEFKDVNGDGKIDMIVHIGDQRMVFINDGTQFKPQQ